MDLDRREALTSLVSSLLAVAVTWLDPPVRPARSATAPSTPAADESIIWNPANAFSSIDSDDTPIAGIGRAYLALSRIGRAYIALSRIGRAYIALTPEEADVEILLARILDGMPAQPSDPADLRGWRLACQRAIECDFAAGEVVDVEGWILSRSECRLCALHAISAGIDAGAQRTKGTGATSLPRES